MYLINPARWINAPRLHRGKSRWRHQHRRRDENWIESLGRLLDHRRRGLEALLELANRQVLEVLDLRAIQLKFLERKSNLAQILRFHQLFWALVIVADGVSVFDMGEARGALWL